MAQGVNMQNMTASQARAQDVPERSTILSTLESAQQVMLDALNRLFMLAEKLDGPVPEVASNAPMPPAQTMAQKAGEIQQIASRMVKEINRIEQAIG